MSLQFVPNDAPDGRRHRILIAAALNTLVRAFRRSEFPTVTYAASITLDRSTGERFVIEVTDASAFTLNEPLNGIRGDYLRVLIKNASGGAMGAITWNAAFKKSAFTNPADGFSRSILFLFDGTNWIQVDQSSVDVPN